jgi:CHAT domain-containing protein/tetratricopeptide (TPR) repeat protein
LLGFIGVGPLSSQTVADSAGTLVIRGLDASKTGERDSVEVAIRLWSQAVALSARAGDKALQAEVLHAIGKAHQELNRLDSALAYFRRALALRGAREPDRDASTLTYLGVVHAASGNRDSALSYNRQALSVYRSVGDSSGESTALANIGAVHHAVGRPDSALAALIPALSLQRASGDSVGQATTLNTLGQLYLAIGLVDSALAYHGHALSMRRALGHRAGEAQSLHNIAGIQRALGRPDSALSYFVRALSIRRSAGDRIGEAATLNNMGVIHSELERPDTAIAYLSQALRIRRSLGMRAAEGSTLSLLGTAWGKAGRIDSALTYYAQALQILGTVGDQGQQASIFSSMGWIFEQKGRRDTAVAFYMMALEMQREARLIEQQAKSLGLIARAWQDRAPRRPELATAYYDSATALWSSIGRHSGGDQNQLTFREQQVPYFTNWTLAWLARSREIGTNASARASLATAERGRAQALLDLMRQSATGAGVAAAQAGVDFPAEGGRLARAVASTGSAALVYFVASDTLLIWLVDPRGDVQMSRQAVSEAQLAGQVAALREGLGADSAAVRSGGDLRTPPALESSRGVRSRAASSADAQRAAARLADWLIPRALADRVSAGGELLIVPYGALNLLPFAALPVDANGQPLGSRYGIRYAPSLAAIAELAAQPRRSVAEIRARPLIVGNPVMPRVRNAAGAEVPLSRLSGAEAEARWVGGQIGASVLGDALATEAEVKRRLPTATVVHLATHGYAYSSEARARDSFVALAPTPSEDGLLTVAEVLDGIPSLQADLVVLSACQTGLGDLKQAEGSVGLQRAFLAKGARSLLVSLWSVSDEATEQLMRSFYTHWLNGASKADALRRAQMQVRGAPGSRFYDPRYWAAFQLVGASR